MSKRYQLIRTSQQGYTLAELLAVTAILVILSTLISGILFSTLRGSSKAKVTSSVTQNGSYAISVMANQIANSAALYSVTPYSGPSVTVCVPAGIKYKQIDLKDFDTPGLIQRFYCDGSATPGKIVSETELSGVIQSSNSLLDTTKVQLVSPVDATTCYIKCTQPDVFTPPQIEVFFKLQQVDTSNFIEQQSSAEFRTNITIRNYKPHL